MRVVLVRGGEEQRVRVAELERRRGEQLGEHHRRADEHLRRRRLDQPGAAGRVGDRHDAKADGGGKGAELAGQRQGSGRIRHGDHELRSREGAIRSFERTRGALCGLSPIGGEEVRHMGAANGSRRFALGLGHCGLGCQWRGVRRVDIVRSRSKVNERAAPAKDSTQ